MTVKLVEEKPKSQGIVSSELFISYCFFNLFFQFKMFMKIENKIDLTKEKIDLRLI